MKNKYLLAGLLLLFISCKKNDDTPANNTGNTNTGSVAERTETNNGITYRLFIIDGQTSYRGILVTGSGNNENNPNPGSLDGAAEAKFCRKAAANGYAAAIVQYRKTPGVGDWNTSAEMIGADYDQCIKGISSVYHIDKSRSVVGGFSYSSFMLLTDISIDGTLSYTKGVMAPCGATGQWNAENFMIPVYSIACSGNNEGDFSGKELYDKIPAGSAVKGNSGGVTDNNCNTHCGGDWTEPMYAQLVVWLH
jgi:hypothetical protein